VFRIPCPHCGPRNLAEFRHVGEEHHRPDPAATTPEAWHDYLYGQSNAAGWTTETWYHRAGCRTFLTVQRHTVTNDIRPATAQGAAS